MMHDPLLTPAARPDHSEKLLAGIVKDAGDALGELAYAETLARAIESVLTTVQELINELAIAPHAKNYFLDDLRHVDNLLDLHKTKVSAAKLSLHAVISASDGYYR